MKCRHTLIIGLILGLSVVAFGSDHPYISDYGTLLDGFEDVNDWIVSGTGATAENDTSIFKESNQGIKLNATGGNAASMIKTVSLDFSNNDCFSLWFYVEDKTKIYSITFWFTSTADHSKFLYKPISSPGCIPVNGWNWVVYTKSEFTDYLGGGESWDNVMVEMKFVITSRTEENISVTFDNLRYGIVGQPKVIMTFDDTWKSQIEKVYPIMAANSQKGVLFAFTNVIDAGPAYLTLADMQTLKAAGWDISNHTALHKDLAAVSQSEMEADIDGGYDWLVANGFGDTAKFFAYPFHRYNDAVIAKVKQRHVLARGPWSPHNWYHFDLSNFDDLQYQLNRYVVNPTKSVAAVQTKIDSIIQKGGLLIMVFHNIVDENATGNDYLTANFQAISDYLKTKQNAGELEVITFSDYYNALIELEPFCLGEPAMDFDGDCKVNLADLAIFMQSWLECNLDPESACWE